MYRLFLTLVLLAYSSNLLAASDSLRVLSWNVFMRPRIIFYDGQIDRAPIIAEKVLQGNYDVVALQEMFDRKTRRVVSDLLADSFPCRMEPRKGGLFTLNSGLLILSRYPITQEGEVTYDETTGVDKWAKKGAQCISINKDGQKIYVLNTHLQSGGGAKEQAVRLKQYEQLQALAAECGAGNALSLIVGDLNTDFAKTKRYGAMLRILKSEDWDHQDEAPTCNLSDNDLYPMGSFPVPKHLDYILLRKRKQPVIIKGRVLSFRERWHRKGYRSLSDHEAVTATIYWE